MGAEVFVEMENNENIAIEKGLGQWENEDIADLKQQLNEAVFLGRFMGAISATLEPGDICAIASRWLYDYVPYMRIIFALSPKLLNEPLVYSPGIAKDTAIDPTLPEATQRFAPSILSSISSMSVIYIAGGDSYCQRHCLELPDGMGHVVIYFNDSSSVRFSTCFLSNLKENFSYVLKNALEHNKLKELAMRDSLTGLFNRRVFDEMLQIEGRRQELMPLSLLMIDLDDFKQINDQFGHQAGDQVLAKFGKILRENFRGSDLVARYGGEEFAVMLPTTTSTIAFEIARRLRTRLAETSFVFDNKILRLTASIGIAYTGETGKVVSDLVRRADQALYRAKKTGKNRTCVYTAKSPELLKKHTARKPANFAMLQPEFQVRE